MHTFLCMLIARVYKLLLINVLCNIFRRKAFSSLTRWNLINHMHLFTMWWLPFPYWDDLLCALCNLFRCDFGRLDKFTCFFPGIGLKWCLICTHVILIIFAVVSILTVMMLLFWPGDFLSTGHIVWSWWLLVLVDQVLWPLLYIQCFSNFHIWMWFVIGFEMAVYI